MTINQHGQTLREQGIPKNMIILVVDDEPAIGDEICETLKALGLEGLSVESVDAALATLQENLSVLLVITDLKMPQKSGLDLIREAENRWPQRLKFIVMSGHDAGTDRCWEHIDNGAQVVEFLRKPIDVEELGQVVCIAAIDEQSVSGGER